MKAKIEQLIEKIIDDMGERPFARTWETEARNMRKILKKHLQSLKDTTEEREVKIKDFSKEQIDDNDINGFRNICKAAGMDFGPYDVEELIKMYKRDKHNIIKI